jgi:hypothetical protein
MKSSLQRDPDMHASLPGKKKKKKQLHARGSTEEEEAVTPCIRDYVATNG